MEPAPGPHEAAPPTPSAVKPEPPRPRHATSWALIRRIAGVYLRPYIPPLRWAVACMAVAALMTGALAWLMEPVLDDVLGDKRTDLIWPVASAVFVTFALRGAASYGQVVLTNRIGQAVVADIQRDLFTRLLTLDLAFFHAHPTGTLMSSVTNDVSVMRTAVTDTLIGIGKSSLTLVVLLVVMVLQDWKLSLAALVIFPFAAIFVAILNRRLRAVSKSIQAQTGDLAAFLSGVFGGVRQVKAYGMEAHEQARAAAVIDRLRALNVRSVRLAHLTTPVNDVLIGLVVAAIVVYGGYQVAAGALTPGQLVSFIAAFTLAYEPMKRLARLNATLQLGLGAAERVFGMLDQQPTIRDMPGARALSAAQPELAFEDVAFAYDGAHGPALRGVNFTAAPGQVTALVGPSGAGKSTVMNLIPRFYDVLGGAVRVDGWDVRELTIASLRAHIALVSQDITIFDASLGANIAYGRPGASRAEVEAAARAAQAHDFIAALPDGYDTQVGENGVRLSGGQRQRIAIARALLRDAPILLLDEATSALDNESEQAVQAALAELERGRTTLVIAHRLSTVRSADQIIVMDAGRVVEAGRHDALMTAGGLYAHMYQAGLRRG
jgi:ATP-binding cassette, subfamily B, bacterial MsbA